MNLKQNEFSENENLSYVFDPSYITPNKLYWAIFKSIPKNLSIDQLDITKVREWLQTEFKDEILSEYSEQYYSHEKKKNLYGEHYVLLKNGLLLELYSQRVRLIFDVSFESKAYEFQHELLQFKNKRKRATKIYLITHSKGGFDKVSVELKKPKIDLGKHYNDDFKAIHKRIVSNLKKENRQGLYLFYGQPGTGKSTYIKYLIQQQNKDVIFVSPKLATELDNVAFTQFLLQNKNTILVIEDAEELLVSRDSEYNSGLSFILNLTDGLLGESLGIQIIATFNTNIQNIDKALLRKGRLTEIYEFKALSLEKTNALLKSLGKDVELSIGQPLSEIFHFNEKQEKSTEMRKVIGFGS